MGVGFLNLHLPLFLTNRDALLITLFEQHSANYRSGKTALHPILTSMKTQIQTMWKKYIQELCFLTFTDEAMHVQSAIPVITLRLYLSYVLGVFVYPFEQFLGGVCRQYSL